MIEEDKTKKEIAKRDVVIQKLVTMVNDYAEDIGHAPLSKEELKDMGVLQKMLKTKLK